MKPARFSRAPARRLQHNNKYGHPGNVNDRSGSRSSPRQCGLRGRAALRAMPNFQLRRAYMRRGQKTTALREKAPRALPDQQCFMPLVHGITRCAMHILRSAENRAAFSGHQGKNACAPAAPGLGETATTAAAGQKAENSCLDSAAGAAPRVADANTSQKSLRLWRKFANAGTKSQTCSLARETQAAKIGRCESQSRYYFRKSPSAAERRKC
jgi:hypothetical protein